MKLIQYFGYGFSKMTLQQTNSVNNVPHIVSIKQHLCMIKNYLTPFKSPLHTSLPDELLPEITQGGVTNFPQMLPSLHNKIYRNCISQISWINPKNHFYIKGFYETNNCNITTITPFFILEISCFHFSLDNQNNIEYKDIKN